MQRIKTLISVFIRCFLDSVCLVAFGDRFDSHSDSLYLNYCPSNILWMSKPLPSCGCSKQTICFFFFHVNLQKKHICNSLTCVLLMSVNPSCNPIHLNVPLCFFRFSDPFWRHAPTNPDQCFVLVGPKPD